MKFGNQKKKKKKGTRRVIRRKSNGIEDSPNIGIILFVHAQAKAAKQSLLTIL